MHIARITSASNQHIRDAVQVRQRRSEVRDRAFLIEGPHLVGAALDAGVSLTRAFVTAPFVAVPDNQAMLHQLGGQLFEVSEQILKKISDTETPQGIVAVVRHEPAMLDALPLNSPRLFVILDALRDPGNLGTIIRTADAAGAGAVILLPGSCDAFMPKVIRATAGSIFHIPVVSAESGRLMDWLKKNQIRLAVTAADASVSLYSADLGGSLALAFGNEAHGVSPALKNAADLSLMIPIFGKAESLNVATSAAVCLYEAVRQRAGGR